MAPPMRAAEEPAAEDQAAESADEQHQPQDQSDDKASQPSEIRLKQARTLRVCGARFKEAHVELCNMTLSHAAGKLGYANPSKLSKVENASDGYPVPLWLLVEASKLYEVSTDFLLGAFDDWERGARMTQEREVSRFQAELIEKAICHSCGMARRFNDELEWASGSIISMAFSIDEVAATLKRVTEINVEPWQEIKGGAKLADDTAKALQLVATARAGLKRFKRTLAAPMSADGLPDVGS